MNTIKNDQTTEESFINIQLRCVLVGKLTEMLSRTHELVQPKTHTTALQAQSLTTACPKDPLGPM